MRSPVRRPLVLSLSLVLLLGASALGAPSTFAAKPPPHTKVAGINVDAKTIPQLQALMNRHRLSSVQLTQFYLQRIRRLNPKLNAVITINPAALAEAKTADAARRHGDRRPLLGIPILVKDNVDTTGMATTAGSWALAGSTPGDAFIIGRLRAAGAFVLAKANLSEWANFRSIPSSSGWTGIGGQTNMAYVLDRNPCGSSSGTAVGISADLATVGIGTETDGSIICPSGANSLVGLKPTLGLWSRAGVIPISAEQDTAGPMARNVTDAAVLLGALTGIDADDPATAEQAGHAFTNYVQFLDANALQGKRIGVLREGVVFPAGTPMPPEIEAILQDAVATLEAQGATVVDPADIHLGPWFDNEFPALLCEFKSDIASYLGTYTGPAYPKTLADLIAFNEAHPDLEGPSADIPWNNDLWEIAESTNGRDADCDALRAISTPGAREAIDAALAENHLDAIIAPTNNPAWVTDPVNGDDFSLLVSPTSPPAVSGYPHITVPAGYIGGLPVGLSFMGTRWTEPQLLGYAFDFEQASRARVPPTFIPSIGDGSVLASSAASPQRAGAAHRDRPTSWKPVR
jgi:amidase